MDKYCNNKKSYLLLNQKSGGKKYYGDRPLNLYLFFDLLQIADIMLYDTTQNDIIILIGHTPSYLKPFLEKKRHVIILPLSNKPYGIITSPNGEIIKNCNDSNVFIPPLKKEKKFFSYLNTKTELTKKFIKKNWTNIVLVDYSSGTSIAGVSIMFNRYVRNITSENRCDISNAKPMKCISLACISRVNTKTELSKKYNHNTTNYRSDLLINLGSICFLHLHDFIINEEFPRYVPSYDYLFNSFSQNNNVEPNEIRNIKIIRDMSKILKYIKTYKDNLNHAIKLHKLISELQYTPTKIRKLDINNDKFIKTLSSYMRRINRKVTELKYNIPYDA